MSASPDPAAIGRSADEGGAGTEPSNPGEVRFRQIVESLELLDRRPDEAGPKGPPSLDGGFPGVEVQDLVIAGPHGLVPARTYRGATASWAGLVWVHGGAFVAGSLDMPEAHWVGQALAALGITVVSLDHRKALRGIHHPVPSDEILAGWVAAVSEPEVLGYDVGQVHLGGASSGANLSAGVAVRLANGEGPRPASLILVYPCLHPELPAAGPAAAAAAAGLSPEQRFTPDFMRAVNVNYVGWPELLDDPVAFPANADVTGLPATYVINAEADDLRASGEAFAAQLRAAGVRVRLEHEPGTVHGYLDRPDEPGAARTVARLVAWLSAGRAGEWLEKPPAESGGG